MATTTIPWGDGSGDNIYLTYSSASGNQTVQVSSDANTGDARSKVITFASEVGEITQALTVNQVGKDIILPDGYTRVQYVQSQGSGSGYLDMGFKASEATAAYQLDMQVLSSSGKRYIIRQNSSTGNNAALFVNSSNELSFQYNSQEVTFQLSGFTLGTDRHVLGVDYYNHRVWADNYSRTFQNRTARTMSSNAALNRFLNNTTRLKANFYRVKIWVSDALTRDYVFCRDSNNTPYAYDIVNETINSFSGTDVIVGPDM